MTSRKCRLLVLAAALAALGEPGSALAQRRRQQGPSLPQPNIQSVFPDGVSAGGTVDVTVRGSDLEGPASLWFDHPGLRAFHLKGSTFRVACATGTPIGHHDVRVVGVYGVSNPRAFVVGDRPESNEVEPNNLPKQATPAAINSVINGEIAKTDVDCFAFEGQRGRRLLIDLEAERIDSRLDATLRLYDAQGREVAESRDAFGADPFLDVTLPADGRYVVKVHDVVYQGSTDHHYRLTLTDGPHLDAVVPTIARPGETRTFTLIGRNLGGEPAPDLSVDGRPLERRTVTLTTPAPDALDSAYPTRGFVPSRGAARRGFEYVLTTPTGSSNPIFIAEAIDPVVLEREPNDGGAKAQAVEPPCDVSGCFGAPGDVDVFRFRAKKGDVYWIEAGAERLGSAADPTFVIQKVNEKGEPTDLATGDDTKEHGDPSRFATQTVDASVRWPVPEDGVYQIAVSDLYGSQRGDVRLAYRLNIRPERPDFHLFLLPEARNQPDAVTVSAGGRALATVLAIRSDGFEGPIQVDPIDLPPGVRCEPTVIGAGQSTAPLVFEASETARPTLGVVRFVGRARFGDRKDELTYVSGATTLGPDVAREAVGGGVVWPLNGPPQQQSQNPSGPPARLTRGFVVKVVDAAPLTLTARASSKTTTPGGQLTLDLTLIRRAGFAEAVTVALLTPLANGGRARNGNNGNQPGNAPPGPTVTIPKTASAGTYVVAVPKNLAPGIYTLVLQGTGPYPFSKDANAKTKPNVTLTEPSNPLTVIVRPAPAVVAVALKGGTLKAGGTLEMDVTVTPRDASAGPILVSIEAPAVLKLSAATVRATPGKPVKLLVAASSASPPGAALGLAVRATVPVRGEAVDVLEPVTLTLSK